MCCIATFETVQREYLPESEEMAFLSFRFFLWGCFFSEAEQVRTILGLANGVDGLVSFLCFTFFFAEAEQVRTILGLASGVDGLISSLSDLAKSKGVRIYFTTLFLHLRFNCKVQNYQAHTCHFLTLLYRFWVIINKITANNVIVDRRTQLVLNFQGRQHSYKQGDKNTIYSQSNRKKTQSEICEK